MKKLLLSLALIIIGAATSFADSWSYEVVKGSYTNHDIKNVVVGTKSGITFNVGQDTEQTWNILINPIDANNEPTLSNDGNLPAGIMIGAAAKPAKDITLYSANNFNNCTISKVTITVAGGAKSNCSFNASVTVGDFSETKEKAVSTNTTYELSWTPNTTGEIEISFTNNTTTVGKGKNAGLKICSIAVEYTSSGTTEPEKQEANLSFYPQSIEVVMGNGFTAPTLTNPNNLSVTYRSSITEVATVDEKNGDVKIVGVGTTTITASSEETDKYKDGEASYTLTVKEAPVLGEITLNGAVPDSDKAFEITEGNVVTFASENATSMIISITNSKNVTILDETIDGATYDWTVGEPETYTISILSDLGSDTKEATFNIISTAKPIGIYTSATGEDFTFGSQTETWPWSQDSKYGYLKGSAYVNGIHEVESIAESPEIDLTDYADAKWEVKLNFDQAFNQYKINNKLIDVADFAGYAYVMVKEVINTRAAGDWEILAEPTAPTAFSWDFYANNPIDLKAYKGKKIQIGFKYVSTTNCAGTWEIKNIAVDAKVSTSISEVKAAGTGATEWFDLQGRRVATPSKGNIYILKQGSRTTKLAL